MILSFWHCIRWCDIHQGGWCEGLMLSDSWCWQTSHKLCRRLSRAQVGAGGKGFPLNVTQVKLSCLTWDEDAPSVGWRRALTSSQINFLGNCYYMLRLNFHGTQSSVRPPGTTHNIRTSPIRGCRFSLTAALSAGTKSEIFNAIETIRLEGSSSSQSHGAEANSTDIKISLN